MANCGYCGGVLDMWSRTCAGCGSPRTATVIGEDDRVFAQVGRAVMARDPEMLIDWLDRHQPRPDESAQRKWSRRGSKAAVGLGLLFLFPHLLFAALALGMLFVFWVYLPYRGIRLLFDWVAK